MGSDSQRAPYDRLRNVTLHFHVCSMMHIFLLLSPCKSGNIEAHRDEMTWQSNTESSRGKSTDYRYLIHSCQNSKLRESPSKPVP